MNPFDQTQALAAHAAREQGRVVRNLEDDIAAASEPLPLAEQQRRAKLSAASKAYWAARRGEAAATPAAPRPVPQKRGFSDDADKRNWEMLQARAAAAGMSTHAYRKERARVGSYARLAKLTTKQRIAAASDSSTQMKIQRAAEARARGMTVQAYYALLREQRGQR